MNNDETAIRCAVKERGNIKDAAFTSRVKPARRESL